MNDLDDFIENNGGYWGECQECPVADWKIEVDNDYTRLGYWEWAYNKYNS